MKISKYFFDKNTDTKLLRNLTRLGLSEKEIAVYLDLIARNTEVGSTKIVLSTGLHRQYVYNALDRLEQYGLIKHVIKNGRKKFLSSPPQRLLSLIEEKRMIANETVDTLNTLYSRIADQEFEVFQGEDQFLTHELSLIDQAEEGDFIDILAGRGDKFREILGSERDYYNKKSTDKKINIRFIGPESQIEYLKSTKANRLFFDYRIMPNFKDSLTSTSIRKNSVTFQIYGTPVMAFVLKSEILARNYKDFFESLWNLCEET